MPKKSKLPFGTSTWLGLTHVVPLFRCLTRWKVGTGENVSFWLDKWCTKVPLAKLFLELFEIGKTKNVTVAEALGLVANGVIGGCLGPVIFQNQLLAEKANELNRILAYFSLSGNMDELVWEHGTETLSVANCYKKLLQFRLNFFSPGVLNFDWSKVWLSGVPSKASFCVWLLVRDRILTHNNLQKRGVSLASRCVFCGNAFEDIDHTFRYCPFAVQVWCSLAGTKGGNLDLTVKESLSRWKSFGVTVHGIIYRDLKPENVLLEKDGHIVLTDFDLSFLTSCKPKVVKPPLPSNRRRSMSQQPPVFVAEPITQSNSFVGTEEYISPEIITGASHSSAIDWWALGIMLYEMLYGRTPFRGKNRKRTFTNILHKDLTFPSSIPVSLACRQLIHELLQRDPANRLGSNSGANEIKQHPFFREINWPLIRCMNPPPLDVPLQLVGRELGGKDMVVQGEDPSMRGHSLDVF